MLALSELIENVKRKSHVDLCERSEFIAEIDQRTHNFEFVSDGFSPRFRLLAFSILKEVKLNCT